METGSKADILGTEPSFSISYSVSEIYIKFGVFSKKASVSKLKYYRSC